MRKLCASALPLLLLLLCLSGQARAVNYSLLTWTQWDANNDRYIVWAQWYKTTYPNVAYAKAECQNTGVIWLMNWNSGNDPQYAYADLGTQVHAGQWMLVTIYDWNGNPIDSSQCQVSGGP